MTGSTARLGALLWLGMAACTPASFAPSFKPPERPTPEKALAAAAQISQRDEPAIVVGVSEAPERLLAFDLSGKLLWERAMEPTSAPLIAGHFVVIEQKERVLVLSARDGQLQAELEDDEGARLVGADAEGNALVVARGYPEREQGTRGLLSYIEGGRVRFTRELSLPVGVPALSHGHIVVPWATHRLSILDATDGAELSRWYFIGSVLGRTQVDRGRMLVGQHGWLRVHPKLLELTESAAELGAPTRRELPGQPPLLRDGYAAVPAPGDAQHRVLVDWRLGLDDRSIEHDSLFVRFYRVLLSLDAAEDRVRWTRSFEEDLVGSQVVAGGLLLADAAGELRLLSADGSERAAVSLGQRLKVAQFGAGCWDASLQAAAPQAAQPEGDEAAQPAASHEAAPAGSLRGQLHALATLPDPRLAAVRSYAVNHLARIEDSGVTGELIALCGDANNPELVQRTACDRLGDRKNGGRAVLAALKPRDSGDDGRPQPPLGALASAVSNMQLKSAAGWLLGYFEDLRTRPGDLPTIANALAAVSYRPATGALERFVRLHHAEPEHSDLAPALWSATDALGALRARSAQNTLVAVAADKHTPKALRERAEQALLAIKGEATKKEPDSAEQAQAAPEPEKEEPKVDPRPRSIDAKTVAKVLAPVHKKLERCVRDSAEHKSSRIAMVVAGDGQLEGIFVTPTELQSCIEPLVRSRRFPATQIGRQRITHSIQP